MKSTDLVVIGGGVIGLSIAYSLAKRGIRATVLDRQGMGRGASWAGAGMLPPFLCRNPISPMVELRSWSAVLYREWSAELRERTGQDNGYRVCGSIEIALEPAEVQEIKTAAGRWRVEGIRYERLAAQDLQNLEPALNPSCLHAFLVPDRAQIRNPWHLRALEAANRSLGVEIIPDLLVHRLNVQGRRVISIETENGRLSCGQVVVAAGAWSGGLLKELRIELPTPPLKGQMVLFQHDHAVVRRIIERGKMYLVPRMDGRILMGATEEDAGFDTRTTQEGQQSLIGQALTICPALAQAKVEQSWAGLRPGSLDTRPYLGLISEYDNLWVATGHKRAGLQLAPASAEVIANLIIGHDPGMDLTAFSPGRLSGSDRTVPESKHG